MTQSQSSRQSRRRTVRALIILAICLPCALPLAHAQPGAQAYCALRDPERSIYELFPEATGFRSSIKNVVHERSAVNAALPYKLHFNELGRHTLYVVLKKTEPIGLIHVRPAQHAWGLVEVAWAFDLDLRIRDFKIQRCRSSLRSHVETDAFRRQFRGRRAAGVRKYLRPGSKTIREDRFDVHEDAVDLAAAVVRSGLTSLVITDIVWADTLVRLRLFSRALTAFGGDVRARFVEPVYTPRVVAHLSSLEQTKSREGGLFDPKSVRAIWADDPRTPDGLRGAIFRTMCGLGDVPTEVWWVIGPDGRIDGVSAEWPNAAAFSVFGALVGTDSLDLGDCQTAAQTAAFEILAVFAALRSARQ